jgi:hypothetical protein
MQAQILVGVGAVTDFVVTFFKDLLVGGLHPNLILL